MTKEAKSDKEVGKFLLRLAVGIGMASLIKRSVKDDGTVIINNYYDTPEERNIITKSESEDSLGYYYLWFFFPIIFFVIGCFYINQEVISFGLIPNDGTKQLYGQNIIALNSSTLGFLENNSNIQTCAKVNAFCNPLSNVFTDEEEIICTTELVKNDNPNCTSFLKNKDWTFVERSFFCSISLNNSDNLSQGCKIIAVQEREDYGNKTFTLLIPEPGKYEIGFDYRYIKCGTCFASWVQDKDPNLYGYDFFEKAWVDTKVSVKSASEIRTLKSTIIPQLILAVFALFGIFPAFYNLQKLWEKTRKKS
jgi:hypothetical protein